MAIRFPCGKCGKKMRAGDEAAGRKARCPACGAVQVIPAAQPEAGDGDDLFALAGLAAGQAADEPPSAPAMEAMGEPAEEPPPGPAHGAWMCPRCGREVPFGQPCPKCRPAKGGGGGGGLSVGKASTVAAIVVVLGALGVGMWWVLNNIWGKEGVATRQRNVALKALQDTRAMGCSMRMKTLYTELQRHAMGHNGRFPASVEEFVAAGELLSLDVQCPGRGGRYFILGPQDGNAARQNVLMYEAQPTHEQKCHVLTVDGKVQLVTREELQAAIDATCARAGIAAVKLPPVKGPK